MATWLRRELKSRGFRLIAADAVTSPAVVTIELADPLCSETVGWQLEEAGFQLSYRSQYLQRHNWMQICLMGECRRKDLRRLVDVLKELCQPEAVETAALPG